MNFRTRIIVSYTVIALILCSFLGIAVYSNSSRYELDNTERDLKVSSEQLRNGMDDRLSRMNAIIYYILSDSDLLDDIRILGMDKNDVSIPNSFLMNAASELDKGINTVYILDNSYRTVFYNETGHFSTSFVLEDQGHLAKGYSLEDMDYIEAAEAANGKSILIGVHEDHWALTHSTPVYSVMKAVQGYNMGYIEVENTIESLKSLQVSNQNMGFVLLLENGELLYEAGEWHPDRSILKEMGGLEVNTPVLHGDYRCVRQLSDSFGYSVITYENMDVLLSRQRFLAFLAIGISLLTFGAGMLMILFLSHFLVRPIYELGKVMEETNIENLQEPRALESVYRFGSIEIRKLAESYAEMTSRLDTAIKEEKRAETLQILAQFDAFQAQINPHFLFNVLNIISARGVVDDDDVICEMCDALADMLRYSTGTKERYALVHMEEEYLQHYFYLLQMRYGSGIELVMNIPPEIENKRLPKLTLHQFVENSYSHGFGNRRQVMRIEVNGYVTEDAWYIEVEDNGEGISEEAMIKITKRIREMYDTIMVNKRNAEMEIGGMGLANTYARCLLLYGDALIFEIRNTEKGTKVIIGVKTNV